MTEGARAQRVRSILIAAQVALTLTLVCGSALMLRSVSALLHLDLGFSAARVLNASITLRQNRYPDPSSRAGVMERMAARLASVPGIESVGLITSWPVQPSNAQPIETAGTTRAAARAGVHGINDAYFATLNIQIVAGRSFAPADRIGTPPVAIVSESLARRLWPGGAIRQRLSVPQNQERGRPVPIEREIVGVVRDVRQGPADVDAYDVYVPLLQTPTRFAFVLVRTAGEPTGWLTPLRAAMREIDPEIAVDRIRPLQVAVDETTVRPRFLSSLLGTFATVAALLALVGVYGVIAYAVRQREREIAVRLAIGAEPSQVTRLFVRQGGVILLSGLALGSVGVLAAGRVIESQLFGITPRDPIALGGAVALFAFAGFVAIWWPSRRAGSTDPAAALRAE
jgi:predicted permease